MRWMSDGDHAAMPGMPGMSDMPAMGGGTGVDRMPGMATAEDLRRLRASSGAAMDVLFLQLMLRHHEGGTGMLSYASRYASVSDVRTLAGQMLAAQTVEAEYLKQLLAEHGAAPIPG